MAETIIDFIAEDKNGDVILILNQFKPWDEAGVYDDCAKRFNGYLQAIVSNALYERYPRFRGHRILIKLNYIFDPSPEVLLKLQKFKDKLLTPQIRFEMKQFDARELVRNSEFMANPSTRPTLVCTHSKSRSYKTVGFFVAFAVLMQFVFWKAAFHANDPSRTATLLFSGGFSILSGGAAILLFFFLIRQPPNFSIDSVGLHFQKDGVVIKWGDLIALRRRRSIGRLSYIDLYLENESRYFDQLSPARRFVAKFGRTRLDPTLSIMASDFDVPEERIYKTIEKYCAYTNLQSRFGV